MKFSRILLSVLGLSSLSAVPAVAQSGGSVCYLRIQPAPKCGAYIVTEAAIEFPFGSTTSPVPAGDPQKDYFDPRFTLTIGAMKNLTPGHAVGAVAAWDFDRGWSAPFRGEIRYRKWMPNLSALDFSAGVTRKGLQSATIGESIDAVGFTGGIGYDWRYIGADLRGEVLHAQGRTVHAGFIGAHASSAGAPVALLIAGAVISVVALSGGAH